MIGRHVHCEVSITDINQFCHGIQGLNPFDHSLTVPWWQLILKMGCNYFLKLKIAHNILTPLCQNQQHLKRDIVRFTLLNKVGNKYFPITRDSYAQLTFGIFIYLQCKQLMVILFINKCQT